MTGGLRSRPRTGEPTPAPRGVTVLRPQAADPHTPDQSPPLARVPLSRNLPPFDADDWPDADDPAEAYARAYCDLIDGPRQGYPGFLADAVHYTLTVEAAETHRRARAAMTPTDRATDDERLRLARTARYAERAALLDSRVGTFG